MFLSLIIDYAFNFKVNNNHQTEPHSTATLEQVLIN